MDFKLKKLPKSEIEILINIPSFVFDGFIDKAVLSLGKDFETQGFRKGKAPKEIVEEKLGRSRILSEAAELAIKENYLKAVQEIAGKEKIEVIGQPEVEVLKMAAGNPLEFKVRVAVLSEIKLPDYKKIATGIARKDVSVSDEDVKDRLNWLQKSRAKFILKNGPAQKGDFVEIEYWSPQLNLGKEVYPVKSAESGVPLKAGQFNWVKDGFILGEGKFIPGFEEEIIGAKSGEEKEFSLVAPKNYTGFNHQAKNSAGPPAGEAGKEMEFEVKINSVQLVELPDVNDDFAKGLGKFGNLEDLKRNTKEGLVLEKEIMESQRIRGEILEKISQNVDFEIPEVLIEIEKSRIMGDLKQRVSQGLKISFEDYLSKTNKTEKEICDSLGPEAQKRVKGLLVLKEISKLEKIEAAEEEIKKELNELLRQYQNTREAEKNLAHPNFAKQNLGGLDPERLREYSKEVIVNEKTLERLESFAGKSE